MAGLVACLGPAPDRQVLAYAWAVIAWGGGEPTEEGARELALAEEEPDEAPVVDPTQLTPAEREEAARIAGVVEAGGLVALSDADLNLAGYLHCKHDGRPDGSCLGCCSSSPIITGERMLPAEPQITARESQIKA